MYDMDKPVHGANKYFYFVNLKRGNAENFN